jgi:hypothetical protein
VDTKKNLKDSTTLNSQYNWYSGDHVNYSGDHVHSTTGTAVIMFTIGINFSATCSIRFKEKEKRKCMNATNGYTAATYAQ